MTRKDFLRFIYVSVVVAAVTTLVVGAGFLIWIREYPDVFSRFILNGQERNNAPAFFYPSEAVVVKAVSKANPAVVAITVSKNVPVYEEYYERRGRFLFPQYRQRGTELQQIGGGSGFLVSSDGYIVSNRHVVADAEAEYAVFMNDGKKYDASVIARDEILDIAILKITGKDFPYLPFADSDQIQVGQSVIAIGNALAEFRNTVSLGIISGLSRSIVASGPGGSPETLDQLIQTDAAINPGNSGGPLLNLSGEVIGINVAIASQAENIGFAISGNSVKNIVDSVRTTGKIIRPYLGVRYIPITEEIQDQRNLSVDYGVLVQSNSQELPAVIPASPAAKAGIVENDIILEIEGDKLTSERSLASIIQSRRVGESIDMVVLHNGKEKEISVTLEELR